MFRQRHCCKCSFVSLSWCKLFAIFIVESAELQVYVEVNMVVTWLATFCGRRTFAPVAIFVQIVPGSQWDYCRARISWSSSSSVFREAVLAHGQTFCASTENYVTFPTKKFWLGECCDIFYQLCPVSCNGHCLFWTILLVWNLYPSLSIMDSLRFSPLVWP